jgi:hypothetical protein
VLSQTLIKLCFLAIAQAASISISFKVGLVGVSIQINLVWGLMAFYMFYRLVISTKSTVIPNLSCA